ncbi:MAG: hypothetical protein K9H84_08325 [Bacteroidales bacterium]|nr:hypothetical protein [Bacteroidales bacterium]
MKQLSAIIISILITGLTYAQQSNQDNAGKPIREYQAFNEFLGGDSLRMCKGQPCTGKIQDYHQNGKIKHKGYYYKGKLTTTYSNFFDNGQKERVFKKKNANKAELKILYRNGEPRSVITYWKGEPLEWKEYTNDGKLEFYELYDKSLEFVEIRTYYYENGSKSSHMQIKDKRKGIYSKKLFYKDGTVKAKGEVIHNRYINAYRHDNQWVYYDKKGNPELKQIYVKGKVIREEEL